MRLPPRWEDPCTLAALSPRGGQANSPYARPPCPSSAGSISQPWCTNRRVSVDSNSVLQLVVAAAEQALRTAWSAGADLLPLNVRAAVRPRSTVVRCLLRSDAPDPPLTVVVKSTRGAMKAGYDPSDTTPQSP